MSSTTIAVDAGVVSERDVFESYRSRPKQLARWLLESRDTLRARYRELKVELKRLKVRVRDVVKSRDEWKRRAHLANQQVLSEKAEVERLTVQLEQLTNGAPQKKVKPQPVR